MHQWISFVDVALDLFCVLAIFYVAYYLWRVDSSNAWSRLAKRFEAHFKSRIFVPFALLVALSLLFKTWALISVVAEGEHPFTFADQLELVSDVLLSLFMLFIIYMLNKLEARKIKK